MLYFVQHDRSWRLDCLIKSGNDGYERPLRLRRFPLFIKEGVKGEFEVQDTSAEVRWGCPPFILKSPKNGGFKRLNQNSI